GSTIESLKYWPYGDRYGSTGTALQKVSFAAMERDPENNHYYDHARKHDFNLARFISPDEIGGKLQEPLSWNRYAYARNNPQRFVDPNGEDAQDIVAGFSNALATDFIAGVGRQPAYNSDVALGQKLGDLISIPLGGLAIIGGSGTFGGG